MAELKLTFCHVTKLAFQCFDSLSFEIVVSLSELQNPPERDFLRPKEKQVFRLPGNPRRLDTRRALSLRSLRLLYAGKGNVEGNKECQ